MTDLHDPLTLPCGQVLPNRIEGRHERGVSRVGPRSGRPHRAALPHLESRRLRPADHRQRHGRRPPTRGTGNVVIEDERDLDALTRWAKSAHDGGVPIWVQLNHPGRQSNPLAIGHTPVAPSAVPLNLPGSATRARTDLCGDRGHYRALCNGGGGL